jgi:iron complex outermembrane recepter protein
MKKFILEFVFLLLIFCSQAQSRGKISGYVLQAENAVPIDNAEIIISGSDKGTTSEENGFFQISDLTEGKYTLNIHHLGYENQIRKVIVSVNSTEELKIYMVPKLQNLSEVVIEGSQSKNLILSKLPYVETILVKEQIDATATRDVGDFLRSANNVGGIRKGGTGIDPVVRGFKYSQLNVQLNNGLKVEGGCPNRMDPATAHVEIDDIETIEVIKGPYALKYGPSFGGTINLITKMPQKCDSSILQINASKGYESNWDGNKEHIGIQGAHKFLFFNLSGGRKDYGNYEDGNGNQVNSDFNKYNYRGQAGFMPVKNHSVLFNYEESHGRDISFPSLPMDERSDDTRLISADYKGEFSSVKPALLKIKIYDSDVHHEMDNKDRPFSDTVVSISKIHAQNFGGRADLQLAVGKGKMIVGGDMEEIRKDGERTKNMIQQPGIPVKKEDLWNNAKMNNYGLFAEYTKKFKSLEGTASARLDFNSANSDSISIIHPMQGEIYSYGTDSIKTNYTNFSFSLGLTKFLNKNFSVSLSLGRGTRSPDMTERFIILLPVGYDNYDYLGNPKLKPETNNQVDLTFKYDSKKIGLVQVNGFYSIVNNYITGKLLPPSEQKPLTVGVEGVKHFSNSGNGQLRGFELAYSLPLDMKYGLNVFASYTYGTLNETTKFIRSSSGEITGEEEIQNDPIAEIPPFEASMILSYRFFKNKLVPKFTLRWVADKTKVSEAQFENGSPGFIVTDFSLYYSFNRYFRVSCGINNLLDTVYYEHLNRNIVGTNMNLYEPGRVFYFNLMFQI